MKIASWGLALVACMFVLGCNDDPPQKGDECDPASFKNHCNADTFVYCQQVGGGYVDRVAAEQCTDQCVSMNGSPGCYRACMVKDGEVEYQCKNSYTLLKKTCITGDNGALIGGIEEIDCEGDTHCVSEGTSAACRPKYQN